VSLFPRSLTNIRVRAQKSSPTSAPTVSFLLPSALGIRVSRGIIDYGSLMLSLSLSLDSVALAGRRATIKSNAGAAIVRASALLRTSFYEAGLRDC